MRVPNWDIKLAEYVNSLQDYPFVWGENDCITFVNNCVEIVRGQSFADDCLGNYTSPKTALLHYRRKLNNLNYDTVIDMLDDRLERFNGRFPSRGSVIGRPVDQTIGVLPIAMGVVVSDVGAFLCDKGMLMFTLEEDDLFWSVD
tara:strand:+ start:1963 stop:2394 length:432 start_codon:yes stop_codon:yes gene_type:complete